METTEKQDKIISVLKERTLGEVIAARRKQLGWSQEELEWRTEISRVSISKIERGVVKPSYDSVEKLEAALGIPLFDLFKQERKKQVEEINMTGAKRKAIHNFIKTAEKKMGTTEKLEEYLDQALEEMGTDDADKSGNDQSDQK